MSQALFYEASLTGGREGICGESVCLVPVRLSPRPSRSIDSLDKNRVRMHLGSADVC